MLAQEHPDLFQKAVEYEQNHADGRTSTWTQGEILLELLDRKDQIIANHEKAMAKQQQSLQRQHLADVLASVLDEEDEEEDALPCLACHI